MLKVNVTMIFVSSLVLFFLPGLIAQYEPNWESLDSRPLPRWFDDAKFGIFLHWGVFSVPSFEGAWFWKNWKDGSQDYIDYMSKNYKPSFTYQDFARDFTAEFYDPGQWADIFAGSGAKYVVLTSKHHEGYTLWPSQYSYSWNAKDVGPGRDVLGDLADAVRSRNLTFGLYHSLYEWFNPIYLSDKASDWQNREFVTNKIHPELFELVETYQPAVIWSDGDWESDDVYWDSTTFLAWLYNDSPVKDIVVTNDRWGSGTMCTHGGYYTCADRYNPQTLQQHKWENAMTIDRDFWGFRRNANLADYLTINELLDQFVSTISCGGNILVNVGPTKEGIIDPIFQDRLKDLGTWLSVNGEAIYSSRPWTAQNDSLTSNVWYTAKDNVIYATALFWPENNILNLGSLLDTVKANSVTFTLLGNDQTLNWIVSPSTVAITFPDKATVQSQWAYVVKVQLGSKDQDGADI